MVRNRGVLVERFLEPVGSVPGSVLDHGILLRDEGREIIVVLAAAPNLIRLVDNLHVLLCVERREAVGVGILYAVVSVVCDRYLSGLSLFRGNEDDAVGRTGTIDGAGCSILEHVDGLDIIWSDRSDVAARDTVDHIDRLAGAEGSETTYEHFVAFSRLSGILGDAETCGLALEGTEGVHRIDCSNLIGSDIDGRTCDEFLLLGTITHHYHFFKQLAIIFEDNDDIVLRGDYDLFCRISDAGNFETVSDLDTYAEFTVIVGDITSFSVKVDDSRANHWHILRVNNRSVQNPGSILLNHSGSSPGAPVGYRRRSRISCHAGTENSN